MNCDVFFLDEVIWICKNLIRQDRSKISIIKKLKQLEIIPIRVSVFFKYFILITL